MAIVESQAERRGDETPLAVVGRAEVVNEQSNNTTLTPVDAEFQSYRELFYGFFEKLNRWNGILTAADPQARPEYRDFDVLSSPQGSSLTPYHYDPSLPYPYDPTDSVLRVKSITGQPDTELGIFDEQFIITVGQAGQQFLVDPEDHTPLKEVTIALHSQFSNDPMSDLALQSLAITTTRVGKKPGGRSNCRRVDYDLHLSKETLRVSHKFSWFDVMTDEMATDLINTIDSLIPQANPQLPEPQTAGE